MNHLKTCINATVVLTCIISTSTPLFRFIPNSSKKSGSRPPPPPLIRRGGFNYPPDFSKMAIMEGWETFTRNGGKPEWRGWFYNGGMGNF